MRWNRVTRPRSPAALRAELKRVFGLRAKETGRTVNQERRTFVMRRFLAVVFSADPDGWILKGGTGMMVRLPRARHTDDVDLIATRGATLDEAFRDLTEAVSSHDDGPFRYQIGAGAPIVGDNGMRLDVEVFLGGGRAYESFHIDLVTLDRTVGAVEHQSITSDADVSEFSTAANICLYPLADQIADKLCVMYQKYGGGKASTRYRDLVDLLLIAQHLTFDLVTVVDAINIQRPDRRDLTFPRTLVSPGGSWDKGWQKVALTSPLTTELHNLDAALLCATPCYDPVLAAVSDAASGPPAAMQWNPHDQQWLRNFEP